MKQVCRIGIVGTGMMGNLQAEAIRRIPGTEIAAVCASSLEKARNFCQKLWIPHAYGDYREMLEKEELDAVHICTPNYTHFSLCKAALEKGIAVYCEKPLTVTLEEAEELCRIAGEKGVPAGVNFNYRHNAIIQDMRERVADPGWGRTFLIHGRYIQDWLLHEDDYNWRCETALGGPSRTVADIGSHWFDTVQFITGKKIVRVFAKLVTVMDSRKKYTSQASSFGKQSGNDYQWVKVDTEDAAFVLVELEDGTTGSLVLSQVSAGYKNSFIVNVDGSRYGMTWNQESADQLLIHSRENGTTLIRSDPSALHGRAVSYATLPAGHAIAWNDAQTAAIRQFYQYLREGGAPAFSTFEDAAYIVRIVEACLESSRKQSWADV